MQRRVAVLPTALFGLTILISPILADSASAQDAGQDRSTIGAKAGSQTFSVLGKFSVFGGVGLDLDVIGDVTAPAVGAIRGTSIAIQGTAYPDVYVRTQRRRYLGASFGFRPKTEIMARYQEANNPASTVSAGVYGSAANGFAVTVDDYKDRLIEFGIRHYLATPKRTRQYFSLLGGMKTVDALGMEMRPPGGANRTALYSKSRIPSLGFELGAAVEYGHVGIYLESGVRWQKRLKRDDTDLAQYELTDVNNTGARFFMPVTLGFHFKF
jgi:hypothetical protein